jgi:hypothetical protein
MSHPTQDARAFGYTLAHAHLHATPGLRRLVTQSPHPLPPVESFDITQGEHVCIAALMGFPMLPYDRKSINEAVGPSGAFTRTVTARVRDVEIRVREANERLQMFGVQIGFDPNKPTQPEEIELLRPFVGELVDHLLQLDADRAYLRSGHSGRLNHLAREYRHANLGRLEAFIEELDAIAAGWGYGAYANLCVPTRFMQHLNTRSPPGALQRPALQAMHDRRDHLKRHAPWVIEAFVASREHESDVRIEVTSEALNIGFEVDGLHIQETITGAYVPNDDTGRLFEVMGLRA